MIIRYFSWIKEHIGKSEEQIELPSHINNVNQLVNYLIGYLLPFKNSPINVDLIR